MLTVTRKTLVLEPDEIMELERIITDEDRNGAYLFLKKSVYRKLVLSEERGLKSSLA